jgi:hypothetical protein
MQSFKKILFVVFVFGFVACKKGISYPPDIPVESPKNNFVYYGDFRIETTDKVHTKAASGFLAYNSLPWKKGEIPVKFSSRISKVNQSKFWNACQVWGNVAKITCRPKKMLDRNYLLITDKMPDRCWTDVGAGAKGGERVFNFALEWCWKETPLIHEIGHVLGLMHEHQRPDRDKYIDVYPEHAGVMAYSYDKLSLGEMDNSGPYDFLSIMHYWNAAYSTNGKVIMVPKKGFEAFAQSMGTATRLSAGDQELIRKIYGAR